ncbi:unnamed protein product [Closterium sp. NIES-65]|nr:unnamed protein product [Closterium sp. NIES-65]
MRVTVTGVPPDPGIETAALGTGEAAALVLPCPAAPSGTLSGLYLPSFSTNLVSGADLQDGESTRPWPTCVPCVEGRQRAAPHSSQFPQTEAPLQTLRMDVAILPSHLVAVFCPPRDVTFDESVPYYRLFPYRTPSLPLPPLFLVPDPPPVDPLPLKSLSLQVCPT